MSYMATQYGLELTQPEGLPYKLYRFSDPWAAPSNTSSVCTPVLFLPGNQGSYKQARTIGYWLLDNPSLGAGQCYTTYTVDFLEQWSVVSERVIRDQSRFVLDAIVHIRHKHKDMTLVIVGHSMGSVVARLALKDIDDYKLLSLRLVSLAAPMDRSPLSLDNRVGLDYSFPALKTVSFCGGSADVQIVPFPSTADWEQRCTETIPMVWSSSDHQGIVWAHQVIEHIGRLIHVL